MIIPDKWFLEITPGQALLVLAAVLWLEMPSGSVLRDIASSLNRIADAIRDHNE